MGKPEVEHKNIRLNSLRARGASAGGKVLTVESARTRVQVTVPHIKKKGVVRHACNPNSREAGRGGFLQLAGQPAFPNQ